MTTLIKPSIPVTFTENAVEEIRALLLKGNYDALHGLRLGVKGGGCAGFSYIIDFDVAKENDHHYNHQGISIFIDKSQEIYLHGCTLDFKKGLDNRGFIFDNPNAAETCGCGTSFSA